MFRRRGRCFRGLGIHAFDCVGDEAVAVAAHTLDYMLEAVPEPVLERLRRGGAVLAVIGAAQVTSDIPQHAYMKGAPRGAGTVDSSTRGLGGHPAIPVTSVGEENLVMRDDAGYAGESLLLHEFAHAVMDIGLGGQPLHDEILACWEAARGRGTYEPKSYIISNAGEYWVRAQGLGWQGSVRRLAERPRLGSCSRSWSRGVREGGTDASKGDLEPRRAPRACAAAMHGSRQACTCRPNTCSASSSPSPCRRASPRPAPPRSKKQPPSPT